MMPEGWWQAFGEQMSKDIENEVKTWSQEQQKEFKIIDVKEKWGILTVYVTIETDEIERIISRYERLSRYTCIHCGQPAMWISKGWFAPYCDNCAREHYKDFNSLHSTKKPWDEYYTKIEEDW